MTVISQKLNSLIGGVSQQPDSLKLPSQLRECINYFPDPTFGLAKRPGFKAIRKMANAPTVASWFFLHRDDEERYTCSIDRNGDVKMWDMDSGIQMVVNQPDASSLTYLTHNTEDDLELFQINDYTLVLNRTVTVEKNLGALTGARTPWALLTVSSVGYLTDYQVRLNNQLYTFQTSTNTSQHLSIEDITSGLVTTINAGGIFTAVYVANHLYVTKNDGNEFRVTATGGQVGSALESFYHSVSSPADLPRQFINNATMQVLAPEGGDDYWVIFKVANGGNEGAGVWEETVAPSVEYSINKATLPMAIIREADSTFTVRRLNAGFAASQVTSVTVNGTVTSATTLSGTNGYYSAGVSFWCEGGTGQYLRLRTVETDANGVPTTLEVARAGKNYLVNDVVTNEWGDTFTITGVASVTSYADTLGIQFYKERVVGSPDTNLWPTFVEKTISGISFFKNRLIFLSGENVICSAVGDYFNFFAGTVTTIDDSDPIDISCGSLTPIDLRYAMGASRGLILFADNAQYILETTTDAFSAASAEINQISSYDLSTAVAPVDMGPTTAFLEQGDRSCSVFEMLVSTDTTTKPQIAELTRTIPSYLPAYVSRMKASPAAACLAIHSKREQKSLYMFRFYNVGSERQQAAWFKWTFPFNIFNFHFAHDTLYMVIGIAGQRLLVRADMITESTDAPLEFEGVPLDLRLDAHTYNPKLVYDAQNDVTRVCMEEGFGATVNNQVSDTVSVVQLTSTGAGRRWTGLLNYDPLLPADEQYWIEVPNDRTAQRFAIGFDYNAVAEMPKIYVTKDSTKDTLNPPTVQRLYLDSYNSGPFRVRINSVGRQEFVAELPQLTANLSNFNELPLLRNAQNVVPVMARGDQVDITIECPFPFPTAINSVTWTGQYQNRGIRMVSV